MAVLISNEHKHEKIELAGIKRFIECCLKKLHLKDSEVSVLITDNEMIRDLNYRYRKENKPTDILSFGMREHCDENDPLPPHPEVLGDLVISMDMIKQQADARKVSNEEELKFIIAHGLLHLIGYDHAEELEKKRMDVQHGALMNACAEKVKDFT